MGKDIMEMKGMQAHESVGSRLFNRLYDLEQRAKKGEDVKPEVDKFYQASHNMSVLFWCEQMYRIISEKSVNSG